MPRVNFESGLLSMKHKRTLALTLKVQLGILTFIRRLLQQVQVKVCQILRLSL